MNYPPLPCCGSIVRRKLSPKNRVRCCGREWTLNEETQEWFREPNHYTRFKYQREKQDGT